MNVSLSYTGQPEIKVKTVSDAIVLSCGGNYEIQSKNGQTSKSLKLEYKDEYSGEYTCMTTNKDEDNSKKRSKILVKFRSKFCSKKIVLC